MPYGFAYEDGLPTPMYLITIEKRVKTGENSIRSMRKLYMSLVGTGSAPRASKAAPKQPHLATTIASPSTTLRSPHPTPPTVDPRRWLV
jgi:hypothetical protein